MIANNRRLISWVIYTSYFLSIIILVTLGALFFGGLQEMEKYKWSVQPNLKYEASNIHYFVKENIQRFKGKYTATPLPERAGMPSFYIYVNESDIEKLNSRLPESGKAQYISGHIKIDQPQFESEAQFRYRGGLPLHWLYDKKSFRVKLPPFTTYEGAKAFNLVAPSTKYTLTDFISYNISRDQGLISPDFFPVRVFVNNEYNGLHYYLSQIDESLLRKQGRMPGSIYSGDTVNIPDPYDNTSVQGENTSFETTFYNKDGESLLWEDYRVWQKDAARNAESENDFSDIKFFVEQFDNESPVDFYNAFTTLYDKEKFYTFWGLDALFGGYHHDNFHNHKIYFDPYKGKFEPIQWDLRFWSSNLRAKDPIINKLIKQVELNPILAFEKDQKLFSLLEQYPPSTISSLISEADDLIRAEVAADPYRRQPDGSLGRFILDKEVPFTLEEYDQSIETLRKTYNARNKMLREVYESNHADYQFKQIAPDTFNLIISVTGTSPLLFDPYSIIDKTQLIDVNKILPINVKESVRAPLALYPGRKAVKGNAPNNMSPRTILAFGKQRISNASLVYTLEYKTKNNVNVSKLPAPKLKALLTNENVEALNRDPLANAIAAESIHPWVLAQHISQPQTVELNGTIQIQEDVVYDEFATVKIAPGTRFLLAPGKSIFFYGKVIASGTKEEPIEFGRLDEESPWGGVVIQGTAASGSELRYIRVHGGSLTTRNLIKYPGQINIHDLDSFTIDHCDIGNNTTGDDSLHVAYTKSGTISNCTFMSTPFDALDIDIARVTVRDSSFSDIGNDAVDLMNSQIKLDNLKVETAGDKCISAGENSDIEVSRSSFNNCDILIAVKDQSNVTLTNNKFGEYRSFLISLYRKNSRYSSGGHLTLRDQAGLEIEEIDKGPFSSVSISAD